MTLVTCQTEETYLSVALGLATEFQGAPRADQLLPLRRLLHVIEGQNIEVICVQLVKEMTQLVGRFPRGTCLELYANDHVAPPRTEFRDDVTQRIGRPAPVKKINAAPHRVEDIINRELRPTTRGQTE